MKWNIALFFCVVLPVPGGDTRVRVSYQEEELELRLPFGSHSRLFLSEVNRAWSGRSALRDIHCMDNDNTVKVSSMCGNYYLFKQSSSTVLDPHLLTYSCRPGKHFTIMVH